jgi:hypothetical protein
MDKIFRKQLIKVFKELVDTLPDNFYELVKDSGQFFDIDIELFKTSESGQNCTERFSTEIMETTDNSLVIHEQHRKRKIEEVINFDNKSIFSED